MKDAAGYVRLYRSLLQNPIWTQLVPAVAKVAIFFLLRANYKSTQWYDGTKTVDVPAGSFITSYDRAAEACNLSRQQVRDAFAHLFRTHFATYTRTQRWTLITVLNWASYQASDDEAEHTEEHAVDQLKNRQGTPDKELRIKNTTTTTAASPLELVPTDSNEKPQKRVAKRPPFQDALEQVARSIHARHPNSEGAGGRRDLGVIGVEKALTAILKHKRTPTDECEHCLRQIDHNHKATCESDGWRKDAGKFVKSLRRWLAPREEHYDVAPDTAPRKDPVRLMA